MSVGEGALDLIATVEECHTVSTWRTEDGGKWGCWWQTVYNIRDGMLTSVHRYINGSRQGLTEVYENGCMVAEVVYVADGYKRMKVCDGSRIMMYADTLGCSIDITCLCS
jgi:hypothetical protein